MHNNTIENKQNIGSMPNKGTTTDKVFIETIGRQQASKQFNRRECHERQEITLRKQRVLV